jgi:signal transduction histidine kinase
VQPTVAFKGPLAWLPRGLFLNEQESAWRHRVVTVVVACHLPALVLCALLTGHSLTHSLVELLPVLVLLAASVGPFGRRARQLCASLALLTCSALLVHLFHGQTELHFHFFVAVALIALYQDWTVFAAAITFVALEHALVGLAAQHEVYDHGGNPLAWAALHAGFVLAESAVLIMFWKASERSHVGEQELLAALWEGQASVRGRLEETERIREDLIGTVSHEFRTPLTGIRGAALTLLKRGERLDPEGRRRLLEGILDHQARLSRLLENVLTASRATAADPSAVAEVDEVATEVAMIAGALRPDSPRVATYVELGTLARMDRHALHQVLANLIDNAQQHGLPGGSPVVAGGHDDEGIWITVTNEGEALDPTIARRLFEPFTQAESGLTRTREGLGMGLYVVHRLVEVYGGTVNVRADSGWITVEVRLRPAEQRQHVVRLPEIQEPTALPMPKVNSAAAPPSKS